MPGRTRVRDALARLVGPLGGSAGSGIDPARRAAAPESDGEERAPRDGGGADADATAGNGDGASADAQPGGGAADATTSEPDADPAVRVEGLRKEYDGTTVFRGLDLTVAPGEFVCLLGPSGCGKTTLLHAIAGLEEPTDGRVLVGGEPVEGPDYRRGVVFQDPHLYPWLSVRENVAIGPRLRGEEPDADRVAELLDLVGLTDAADADPSSLSGGMAQRVALARTLANDPELLLLDEPFSALDELTKMELQDELARIVDELGLTAVFVTHDIEEAVYLGDRVVVLGEGAGGVRGVERVSAAGRARDDAASMRRRRDVFELLEADHE